MKLTRYLATGLLAATLTCATSKADEWADYRFTLNAASIELTDSLSTRSHLEVRSPNFDGIRYVRFSQQFYTKLGSNWKLGTHPTFENARVGDEWFHSYHLHLELNPARFKIGDKGPSISMRNRWELRWRENQGSEIFHRFRQRTIASWDLNWGPFTKYSLGDEIFFEEHKGKISMNRIFPIILETKPKESYSISYYGMYQSARVGTSSDWGGIWVFGAMASF